MTHLFSVKVAQPALILQPVQPVTVAALILQPVHPVTVAAQHVIVAVGIVKNVTVAVQPV